MQFRIHRTNAVPNHLYWIASRALFLCIHVILIRRLYGYLHIFYGVSLGFIYYCWYHDSKMRISSGRFGARTIDGARSLLLINAIMHTQFNSIIFLMRIQQIFTNKFRYKFGHKRKLHQFEYGQVFKYRDIYFWNYFHEMITFMLDTCIFLVQNVMNQMYVMVYSSKILAIHSIQYKIIHIQFNSFRENWKCFNEKKKALKDQLESHALNWIHGKAINFPRITVVPTH